MRHGFVSGNSYYSGWINRGTFPLIIFLIIAAIGLILFFNDYFRKKKYPENYRLLEILKEKYETNKINVDEYNERSMIIDDDDWLNPDNPRLMKLKEQYANCEIDSPEYIQKREQINNERNNSALTILMERYAKGEISSEDFQQMKMNLL